jgi:hypothetical protein
VNEKQQPDTLESLQEDAGRLYGQIYSNQSIGGAATIDELIDVMGISLRILNFLATSAPPIAFRCPGCEYDNAPHLASCNKSLPVGNSTFDPSQVQQEIKK